MFKDFKDFSIYDKIVRSDLKDNKLEVTIVNEKENQALKERIEELEKENRWLETRLKISRETNDILIKFLIKGD